MNITDRRTLAQNTQAVNEREGGINADVRKIEATVRIAVDENCPITVVQKDDEIEHIDIGDRECAVSYKSYDINNLCQRIKSEHGEFKCEGGGSQEIGAVELRAKRMTACICSTFKEFGCTPRIQGVSEDSIKVSSYFTDREQFKEVISELQTVADSVQVIQLGEACATEQLSKSFEVDVGRLSQKQREMFLLAMDRGYFENPRKISQEDLAEELDISPSLVSRRMRAIQSKLFSQIEGKVEC